jgi:hypothetical protein
MHTGVRPKRRCHAGRAAPTFEKEGVMDTEAATPSRSATPTRCTASSPFVGLRARAGLLGTRVRALARSFEPAAVAALARTVPLPEADALARLIESNNGPSRAVDAVGLDDGPIRLDPGVSRVRRTVEAYTLGA